MFSRTAMSSSKQVIRRPSIGRLGTELTRPGVFARLFKQLPAAREIFQCSRWRMPFKQYCGVSIFGQVRSL